MRAEDAQGKPTQSHISPTILVYEEKTAFVNRNAQQREILTQCRAFCTKAVSTQLAKVLVRPNFSGGAYRAARS